MMHIHMHNRIFARHGSIILEIAVAAPVFLLLGAFMLTAISCARADILFSCAVDQVTQELAVAVPLAGAGIDLAGEAMAYINNTSQDAGTSDQTGSAGTAGKTLSAAAGGAGAVLEALGIEGGDVLGTLLLGKGIRDRIVQTFSTYNSNESLLHSRIQNVSVYVDYDASDNIIWLYVYYQWNTLFGPADKTIVSAVPIFGDLELSLPETEGESSQKDEIWLKGNFERGFSLRNTYGGNLPSNYPVIARWENGTATSIKSIDLTAPEYQSGKSLSDNISEFIDDLAEFSGTADPWGKDNISISGNQITQRVLIIIIPENSPAEVYDKLMTGTAYAAVKGVEIRIEKYGNSYRYIDKVSADISPAVENTGEIDSN